MLVLQNQALLQRHRHGSTVLGAFAAGESDPIKAAADLPTGEAALRGETVQNGDALTLDRAAGAQLGCGDSSPQAHQPFVLHLLCTLTSARFGAGSHCVGCPYLGHPLCLQDAPPQPRPHLRHLHLFADLTSYPLSNCAHTILSCSALWCWPLRRWWGGQQRPTEGQSSSWLQPGPWAFLEGTAHLLVSTPLLIALRAPAPDQVSACLPSRARGCLQSRNRLPQGILSPHRKDVLGHFLCTTR